MIFAIYGLVLNHESLWQIFFHQNDFNSIILISGFFKFELLNGSKNTQYFYENITFITPPNVASVFVEIQGIYESENISVSSERLQTFFTYEQYKQNKKDFVTYMGALIVFILLSVPSIVDKWINIFVEKKKLPSTQQKK